MCIYYEDNSGKIYWRKAGYVVYFDLEKKNWDMVDSSDESGAAEHLVPEKTDVTQISEEQAMLRLEGQILDNLDREELHKYIELLCQNRQIGWSPEVEQSSLAFLQGDYHYPPGLYDIFGILGSDHEYRFHMATWPENLLPTDMNLWQIRTALTYIVEEERFGEDIIAHAADDGTLLKLLFRLDDLLNAHQGRSQHW